MTTVSIVLSIPHVAHTIELNPKMIKMCEPNFFMDLIAVVAAHCAFPSKFIQKLHYCWDCVAVWTNSIRVRPIPCWRPIPNTRYYRPQLYRYWYWNDVTYSLRQTYITYIAHSICTFQNITSLTSWTAAYLLLSAALQECISYNETNYRLKTIGVRATVLTVKTGKWTTGIGTDTKISIGRYWYSPILAGIGRYLIPVSV